MTDIYCEQIISGRIPVEIVLETDRILAFHHTKPYFERHIVVIPKSHIDSLSSLESLDPELAIDFMKAIHEISSNLEREFGGCRICSNVGSYQNSKHLHWYIHAGHRVRAEDGTVLEHET